MSPSGEQPLNRSLVVFKDAKDRRDLERKVLSAAFKLSFEGGDTEGAAIAHKGLCSILQAQLFEGDGSSTGSVIPASVWQQAPTNEEPATPVTPGPADQEPATSQPSGQGRDVEVSQADAQMLAFEASVQRVLEDGLEATAERTAYGSHADSSPAGDGQSKAENVQAHDDASTIDDKVLPASAEAAGDDQPVLAMPVTEKPLFEAPVPQFETSESDYEMQSDAMADGSSLEALAMAPDMVAEAEEQEEQEEEEEQEQSPEQEQEDQEEQEEQQGEEQEEPSEEAPEAPSQDTEEESEEAAEAAEEVAASEHLEEDFAAVTEPELQPAGIEEMPFDAELQPSAEAIAEMIEKSAAMAPPPAAPVRMSPSQLIKQQSYYQILGVNKLSSFEVIHKRYWKIMRRLLRNRYAENSQIRDLREFREVLRTICVAHDVLKDPVTRTDYDLRQLGMRSAEQIETPADDKPTGLVPRTRLMLGELLECANILEPAELQMAVDMHKAEAHLGFGDFLVRANFISQDMLDASLLGQKLVSSGKITIAQFQTALFRMRDHGTAFFDTMMVEGWLTPADILDDGSMLWQGQPTPPSSGEADPLAPTHSGENGHENGDHGDSTGGGENTDSGNGSVTPDVVPQMSQEVALARSEKGVCNDTQAIDVRDWRAALRGDEKD